MNVERSPGTKFRELAAVLLMFAVMVFVVRRSFDASDQPAAIPTRAPAATVTAAPLEVAGDLELQATPPKLTTDSSATFTYAWTGTEPGAFECRVDTEEFAACPENGELLVGVPDGIHTFQVRRTREGDEPTDALSYSWTVDTQAPSVAVLPEGGAFVTSPLVTLEASEVTDIFYTLDGAEPSADSLVYRAPLTIETPTTVKAVAIDEAGNTSPVATGSFAFTTAFRDGFESGGLDAWSDIDGLAIEPALARTGATSARASSVGGTRAYAALELGALPTDLFLQTAFRIESRGDNPVSLARLRTDANAPIVTLYVTTSGRLAIQLAGSTSVTSSVIVSPRAWHEVQAHVVVRGGESRVEVWFDGQYLDRLNIAADLGEAPIRTIQLGESAEGRTFDVAFDDFATSDVFIPTSFLILISGPTGPAGTPVLATPVASPVPSDGP